MSGANHSRGPRRSRHGLLLGVIKGLCDHFGLSIFFARAAIVALAILTSAWIVALFYLAAFLIMPLEPRGSSGRSWTAARP